MIEEGCTVLSFLHNKEINVDQVVVELNGKIIKKEEYRGIQLHEGDRVEILQLVGGG